MSDKMSTQHSVPRSVVKGTFSQSDKKYGDSAGNQCAANSLMAICWTKLKQFNRWTTSDLDNILDNGDQLYKHICNKIHEIRHLDIDDLPDTIPIFNENCTVTYERDQSITGYACISNKTFTPTLQQITDMLNSTALNSTAVPLTGFLMFFDDLVFALLIEKFSDKCFLFDSHSRNHRGVPVTSGASVLMKFNSSVHLENYLYLNYCEPRNFSDIPFQIYKIHVEIADDAKTNIIKIVKSQREKERYKKNHKEIKKAKKRLYAEQREQLKAKARRLYRKKCQENRDKDYQDNHEVASD